MLVQAAGLSTLEEAWIQKIWLGVPLMLSRLWLLLRNSMAVIRGADAGSMTTVRGFELLRGGEPSSVTVMVIALNEPLGPGRAQLNTPVFGSMPAPGGALGPRL